MSNQPNWDEAPEGATHYWLGKSNHPWYKVEGREKYQYFNETNQWIKINVSNAYFTSGFVTRPTVNQQLTVVKEKFTTEEVVCSKMETTSWDGEGYPPIGTICEMYIDEVDEWVQGEVIAIHKGYIHIWNDKSESGCFTNNPTDLRPIKSDRNQWVDAAVEACKDEETLREYLEQLYDTTIGETSRCLMGSHIETTPEFNNIPEGATHYRPECNKWYFSWAKYEYGRIYIYSEEEPWWEHWGTFPVEELIPITSNTTDLPYQLKTKWIESIIENKEELYKQLGHLYDTMI